MKYRVNLTQKAIDDIGEIFEYISSVLCEKETAINIINLLHKNILSLEEMPGRFRIYENEPWKSRGLHIMPVKKYLVFYMIDDDKMTVNIVRVLYGSRDYDKLI